MVAIDLTGRAILSSSRHAAVSNRSEMLLLCFTTSFIDAEPSNMQITSGMPSRQDRPTVFPSSLLYAASSSYVNWSLDYLTKGVLYYYAAPASRFPRTKAEKYDLGVFYFFFTDHTSNALFFSKKFKQPSQQILEQPCLSVLNDQTWTETTTYEMCHSAVHP